MFLIIRNDRNLIMINELNDEKTKRRIEFHVKLRALMQTWRIWQREDVLDKLKLLEPEQISFDVECPNGYFGLKTSTGLGYCLHPEFNDINAIKNLLAKYSK